MKSCRFLKVIIFFSLIFFTNKVTTTYAKAIIRSHTYTYKNTYHNFKTYKPINNLSFNNKTSNTNYDELIVVSCSNDLDGDDVKESIELVYNGDFILKIDDQQTIIEKNVYYCPRNILLCPNLEIVDGFNDKYKIIIISYSEATLQINPTVRVWIYQYRDKNINERDSLEPLS